MNALHPRPNGPIFTELNSTPKDIPMVEGVTGRLRELSRGIALPAKKIAKTTIDTEHVAIADKPAWARSSSQGSDSDASSRDEEMRDAPSESNPVVPARDSLAEDDDKSSLVGIDILTEQWEALIDMLDGAMLVCCYEDERGSVKDDGLAGLAFVSEER